jgi:hypothetical protein
MISERLLSIKKKLSPFVFFFQVPPPVPKHIPSPSWRLQIPVLSTVVVVVQERDEICTSRKPKKHIQGMQTNTLSVQRMQTERRTNRRSESGKHEKQPGD